VTRRFTTIRPGREQAGYSRAVRRGNGLMVSGTTATGPDGAALHPGDTGAQAGCLGRIEAGADGAGGRTRDVVRTVVYLAPEASWEQGRAGPPRRVRCGPAANTTLYAAGLIGDGFLVRDRGPGGVWREFLPA